MDYLGWELERQRSALAALLLGGGKFRSPVQDGAPGRYAESSEEPLGAWEAVWALGQAREGDEAGAPETPVSAWEAILGGETDVPAISGEGTWTRLSGGTGAQPEFPRLSGRHMVRRGMRRTGADLAAGIQGPPAKSEEDGAGDGTVLLRAGASQNNTAKRPGRFRRIRRGREPTADTTGRDEPPVIRTSPWGGWGAAVLRAEDSAKTLSRAVQRDARRYDGGFNIL